MSAQHTPTPYDVEIAEWAEWVGPTQHGHNFDHLIALQEGYLRCLANYTPLLEAARHIMEKAQSPGHCPFCHQEECDCWTELGQAIAAAGGRTA